MRWLFAAGARLLWPQRVLDKQPLALVLLFQRDPVFASPPSWCLLICVGVLQNGVPGSVLDWPVVSFMV